MRGSGKNRNMRSCSGSNAIGRGRESRIGIGDDTTGELLRTQSAMYSTRNLIVNGGFTRTPPAVTAGWNFPSNGSSKPSWRQIAVPGSDHDGLPHSPHAIVLENGGRLSQEIEIHGIATRRFAVRLAARGATPGASVTLVASVRSERASGHGVVFRQRLHLSPGWARYRTEFEVPETACGLRIEVEVEGPGQTVTFTDVHLVGLLRTIDCIAIRFDTCGDISRASSRLRAFLLEDYLHLLGCRTFMNRGNVFDVYICQKVWPWLGLARAKLGHKAVVFDLDDTDLLYASQWDFMNIRRFARTADAVSVGSEFLRKLIGDLNSCTFLLENPIDILDQEVARADRPWGGRLVWFGMPENRWMLERLGLNRPVTQITRGGSVEYDLKSIDQHLVASDLALLPVFLNEETRAKNANRLIKCVGLSLPFLASDTPEHRRVLRALQLPDELLVASEHDWPGQIDDVARDYARFKRLIDGARPRAFELYGVERIVTDWLPMLHKIARGR
jgi:hypothetical protein